MIKFNFYYKLLKSAIFLVLCIYNYNTIFSQNVASGTKNKLDWKVDNGENTPSIANFSLQNTKLNGKILPCINFSFDSKTKSTFEFSNLEYQELIGFEAFKIKYINSLGPDFENTTYYSFEGSNSFVGVNICPFKVINSKIYKLTSFEYEIIEGVNFTPVFNSGIKRALTNSQLASGQWIKLSVTTDGLYRLDANWFKNTGIDINSIDPRTIKIYGTQGGMLPEDNSAFRYDDLPENAIQVIGENDGKFDAADYVLFYAQGPHKWTFNYSLNRFEHIKNIYSDKAYLFLTVNGNNGKRISTVSDNNNLISDKIYDWFDYHTFHDLDLENVCKEGRIYTGEVLQAGDALTFNESINNIESNRATKIYFHALANAPANTSLALTVNNTFADALNFGPPLGEEPPCFTEDGIGFYSTTTGNSNFSLKFAYNTTLSSAKAYFNYYELQSARKLIYSEGFMGFRVSESGSSNVSEYRISGLPTGAVIYDLSDPVNIKIQNTFLDNGVNVFRNQASGQIHEFAVSDGSSLSPTFEGSVANQNLRGTSSAQFVIVSPTEFLEAANKLANFHRTRDQMSVLVVTPEQIYNEFSSGGQDISAIRDYFKLLYYNNTNPANQLKYALLLGDASYDYLNRAKNNNNFIPTYEGDPILLGGDWYCSDDFFGFLDPTDGEWSNYQKLEMTVSRLPVASLSEANGIVNKIIKYKEQPALGDWRNVVTFLADDIDLDWETVFVKDFEEIFNGLDTQVRNINVKKIYLDAYNQQNLGGSQRYPDAQEAIKKEFEKGSLIFNYMGHGGDEYIASEKVIDIPLVNSMTNINNLPAFFTASCTIGKYDDLTHKSGGEYFITNPNGGAIAMFTTVRIVYVDGNADITKYFWSNCAFVKIGGKWPTLGDIYKKLKNRYSTFQSNDRKFTLFADPALTLNYPENIIKIDSLNSKSSANSTDTLKALSKVTFKGHIEDVTGTPMNSFNGLLYPTIYDKKATFLTLGNNSNNIKESFDLYNNILYKGESSITNGRFSFSFVVPKDIAYNYGFGKVSLYGKNESTDAAGNMPNLLVGGTASNVVSDGKGPELELFVDDYSFITGGLTDQTPLLLARISDENGVNTSGSGIGRDLLITIDKGTVNEKNYVVNTFYKANLNSYTSGEIKYALENIKDGKHTYTLKVWDVYNNSSEATIEFMVSNGEDFQIKNVLNYPNPFSTNTIFHFDHNKAGQNLNIVITIFSISGKVIKTIDQFVPAANGHVSEISWNGRDDYDDKPSKGVYIYRIRIRTDDGQSTEKIEKLVILN